MHEQFHRACVCQSILVETQRERKRERKSEREKKKKRCWVHDSCKPQGHTSPRLAPPLATLAAPFLLPLSPSICLFSPLCPFTSLRARRSQRVLTALCTVAYAKREGGRRGNPGGSWGKRWLRHKPAIPARMTGDYVIQRDVRVLVCTGSRARSFVRPACVPRDARFTNEPRPPGSNSPH